MIFLELALQGIKGFPDVVRLPLQAGVNVASPLAKDARIALVDAIYHCLFPDGARAAATEHLRAPGAAQSRIALTFHGRDKVTYRLIRDVVTGATKLYRFDAESKKYRLFTDVANEAAQYVRVQQQLPDDVTFERLFVYAEAAMPSAGTRARTRSGAPLVREAPAPSGPGLPQQRFMSGAMGRPGSLAGAMPNALEASGGFNPTNALVQSEMAQAAAEAADALPETIEERKSQLVRLRADLDAVVRGRKAQVEIDQLAARKFEINERVEETRELERRLRQLELQSEDDKDLDNLPPNISERLKSFETRVERFKADEGKILEELARMEQEAETELVLPLIQDRYFQVSVLLAVLFLVVAAILARPFIALLNIPAAMVAVAAGLRYVADLEQAARRKVRLQGVEDRLDRLHRQHDLDTGVTRRLMEKLGIDTPSELLERVQRVEARAADRASVGRELEARRRDPVMQGEQQELEHLERRVASLEAEVIAAAGATSSEAQLERRVKALEQALGPDVPPRKKSPPLGLGSDGIEASARDLSLDLVAQSPFSSHVSAQSPLAPDSAASVRPRQTSGVFPPPRGTSGLGITGDLPSGGTPMAGVPAFSSTTESGGVAAPSRGPLDSGGYARVSNPTTSGRTLTPQLGLPAFPGPAPTQPPPMTPPPPRAPAPSAPGLPPGPSGPVVPKGSGGDGLFDFGGGYIGDDEDDDPPPERGSGDEGDGQQTAGYLAMGSGFSGFGGGGVGDYSGGGEAELPDRSRELVQATIDLLSVEVDKLAEKLVPRLGQYLHAFTGGRYVSATLGPRGEVTVGPAEGEPVLYRELEGENLDPIDAALRFTLAEFVVRKYRIPVIVEEPFMTLDDKRRKLLGQMLGYFGRGTQVLVFSETGGLDGHPISLKS